MVRLSVLCKVLVVLAVAVALFGCASSATTPSQETTLDRWLQGGEPEPGAAAVLPDRAATPPQKVELHSLEVEQGPVSLSDLPKPDYYSFELHRPTYVRVAAISNAGAAVALIDRRLGEFARDGVAGESDGIIETLLDAGEYRVRLQTTGEADRAAISVVQYNDVQEDRGLLMNSAPGTLHTSSLTYYEQRSFWIRVPADEPLMVEAMGRSLRAVRIWKDGVWVMPNPPQVSEYSPVVGQAMGYVQISERLPPGDYLFTFYGGSPRVWASDSEDTPFFVRFGARQLGSVIDANTEISAMGRDAFLVSGDVTVLEIENGDFVPASLGISRYGDGLDRFRAIARASIDRSDESTRSRTTVSRSGTQRWLFVAGTPGDTVRIRAIPERTEYLIEEPTQGSQYLISTVSTLDSDHAIDVTPMIFREAATDNTEEVIRSDSLTVTDTPLVREINLFSPIFFIADLGRSGNWGLVHDMPDDSPVAVSMIPLREFNDIGTPQVELANPASFDLEAGQHMVMIQASRPGIFRFALYYRGSLPAFNDNRAVTLLRAAPPVPRQDMTYVTAPNEITSGREHAVVLNERGGPQSALFVERLPLSLEEGVPLTLAAGESLSLPVAPRASGLLSAGYSTIEIRRNNQLIVEGGTLPSGRSTLLITNTADRITTFVLRLDPHFVASYTAPAVPELEELLPILRPGPAAYHDYQRGDSRQFLLIVDEPGFYELQTTGRLSMRVTTRTQANPIGHNAQHNGPGRNAIVQTYFRPGTYLVEVGPEGTSAGRAGLVMLPLPMLDLGQLNEGAWYRSELDPGVGVAGAIGVETAGTYSFRTIGLYGGSTTRLEDADAWPVQSSFLFPGAYRYYSWPQTVWNRRLTGYFREPDESVLKLGEPWPLEINGTRRRTWNETANRTPHQFLLASPATVPVTLRTSSQMEWWVTDVSHNRIHEGQGTESFDLPAGILAISIRSKEENNNAGYEISLSTPVLADGLAQQFRQFPAVTRVIIEDPGIYEFSSSGTWDVRASLRLDDVELAAGDDRPGDWNFHISRYLPAGEYVLDLSESFPGTGVVTVAAQRRDEVWVETQTLPVDTRLRLDQTIVGIPFRSPGSQTPVRITTDASAVHLALYREEVLVAEGQEALFVPLLANQDYLLRVRNESIIPTQVGLQISTPPLERIEWDGVESIELPPGAAAITNMSNISVVESPGRQSPLLSGAIERSAQELDGGVLANPGGTFWSWVAGRDPVPVQPFVLDPGAIRVLEIAAGGVSVWIPPAPGIVYVLDVRTVAGYLGAQPAERLGTARDWTIADPEMSSTFLGLMGDQQYQVWLWDGEPHSEGRRVELAVRDYAIDGEIALGALNTVTVPPGSAIAVATSGVAALDVLLSPGMVAITADAERTLRTVASRDENRSATLPAGTVIYLVNTGNREHSARVIPSADQEGNVVSRTSTAETILPEPGTFTARVLPGAGESSVAIWAVAPSEIFLLTDSGRRIQARSPEPGAPYYSLPGIPGELRVTADKGPVVAWLEYDGRDTLQWASQRAGGSLPLLVGDNIMATSAQRWEFRLDQTAFVLVTTENRGITALVPGGDQASLEPQLRFGAGTQRRAFAVLGAGTHRVITRPIAGEPQPGPLRLHVLDPITISEALEADEIFLDAGERAVFQIDVIDDVSVGIGMRAESDDFVTFLLNDQLGVVGSGRVFYRELSAGRYYLLAENGNRPMNVVPVVRADQGSRTGVPEEVIEGYRGQ